MINEIRDQVAQCIQDGNQVGFYGYVDFNDVQALLAEIDRLRALNEWQDLATAPKNKRLMLRGYNSMGKYWDIFGLYADKHSQVGFYGGDYCEKLDLYYWPEGWYEETYEGETAYPVSLTLTHWMLLPQPPESEEK